MLTHGTNRKRAKSRQGRWRTLARERARGSMAEMLLGLMQDRPLQISAIIGHGARYNGRTEIVSRGPDGALAR